MDKEFITVRRWSMVLFDDIVDMLNMCQSGSKLGEIERGSHSNGGADEESKDEG